ncbi:nitrogen assimilation regulatory protein for GlnL, GlnE, and AmtB [Syntrophobacter sp. SbD1]|nr:nitrogen assimilation regulatory protein for GlnL, GlnE, and AmtB [Syntrophobacter sp. SbD1]
MVKIEAIIKPFKLEEVRKALLEIGVQVMTVFEVKGFGRQKGHIETYRSASYTVNFEPDLMLTLSVNDDQGKEVVKTIQNTALTGKIGDGKLFVTRLEYA